MIPKPYWYNNFSPDYQISYQCIKIPTCTQLMLSFMCGSSCDPMQLAALYLLITSFTKIQSIFIASQRTLRAIWNEKKVQVSVA